MLIKIYHHDYLPGYVAGEHYLQSAIVVTGVLDSGSISSGFGAIDINTSAFTSGSVLIKGATQDWKILESTALPGSLAIQGQVDGASNRVGIYPLIGDGTDNVVFDIYGMGTPGNTDNRERISFSYHTSHEARITTNFVGTGTAFPIKIYTSGNTDQINLQTDGDVSFEAGDVIVAGGTLRTSGGITLGGSDVITFDSGVLQIYSDETRGIIKPQAGRPLRIGDGTTNYIAVSSTGDLSFHGSATVWDDIQNSLIGKRLSSTAGKVDYNWTENSITFQPSGSMAVANDRVIWNQQFPHAAKAGSSLYPHIHFEQVNSNKIEFTLAYRIQSNNTTKTTTWTEIVCNSDDDAVYSYSSGTLTQIVSFPAISMAGKSISSTVQFRLVRDDATVGNIEVTFVDCHVEYDMVGSREQYTK